MRPDERPSLLDVYCARCEADGRRDRGRLGRVVTIDGRLVWISHDRRVGRVRARTSHVPDHDRLGVETGAILHASDFPDLAMPEQLRARCRTHGTGWVDAAKVLAAAQRSARAQRGYIALPLS